MNFEDINKNKILLMFLVLMIVFTSGISDSFAQFPESIEITIENVTINTPTESSTDESKVNPLVAEITTQIILAIAAFLGAGGLLIWKLIEIRATKDAEIETTKAASAIEIEKEKAKPTTLEQDKIFNQTAQEAYYQSYLPIWRKIWEVINDKPERADSIINYIWEKYFDKRQIPTENSVVLISEEENLQDLERPPAKTPEDARNDMIEYIMERAERFHLNSIIGQRPFVEMKLKHLFNSSDVKYYGIITTSVPGFVEKAVLATYDIKRNIKNSDKLDDWEEKALKALKRLMIFAFLREDSTVLKIMIRSEINKIISKKPPTTRTSKPKTRKKKNSSKPKTRKKKK